MSFFHSLFFICFANELTGFFAKEILVVIWLTMFLLNQIFIKVLQSTLYYFILGYSSQVVWMAESFLVNFDLLSSPFLMVLKYNKFHWLNTYVKVSQLWLWKLFFSHRQLVVFVEYEIEKSMFQIHSFFLRLEKTRRNQKLYIKKQSISVFCDIAKFVDFQWKTLISAELKESATWFIFCLIFFR